MVNRKRTHNFNIRLDDDEHAMLAAIAERSGLSASDLVRQFIRQTYRADFGDAKPSGKKRKR